MVVIVILGLLATLVVPKVMDSLERAKKGKAISDINSIASALDDYAINNGNYPETLQELVEPDENGYSFLKQKAVPMDPWNSPYQYVRPGAGATEPVVSSFGADGAVGGEGRNSDISNITILGGETD